MLRQKKVQIMSQKYLFTFLFVFFLLPVLGGCDLAQNHLKTDREASLEVQDYRDGLASRLPEDGANSSGGSAVGGVPSLQPYIGGSTQAMKSMPLVSISVNQTVPIRDILFELAEQADYDLELDPRIRGSIIFTARERPFDEVVQRIADVAGLRYKFENDVLRVELDTPYNKVYKTDYLSYVRSNKGSIRSNVSVVSGGGADSGSSFEAATSSEADFWKELDRNLQQILGGAESSLKTNRDPRITATEQNPDVAAVAPPEATEDGQVQVAPPEAVLRVDSLPVEGEEDVSGGNANGNDKKVEQTFSINKQAGMINVYANEKTQKEVAEYLDVLRRSSMAQVLIEAKILEVSLSDQYATGIDWRALNLFSGEGALNFLKGGTGTALDAIGANTGTNLLDDGSAFAVAFDGNDVQSVIQAMSKFGTVKALASPRMTVLNNQSAVLNVATNEVYFEISIDRTEATDNAGAQTDITSEIRNVPVGVLVNVLPSIDLERRTISMAVRPTVTSIDDRIVDPGVAFVIAECGADCSSLAPSKIPQLNVQEVDSVVQVDSGQAVIMGGLLQDKVTATDDGVPVMSEVPMLGSLFKQHTDSVSKTELVIFLKATILDAPSGSVHNTDRDLYRMFSSDRRPLKL